MTLSGTTGANAAMPRTRPHRNEMASMKTMAARAGQQRRENGRRQCSSTFLFVISQEQIFEPRRHLRRQIWVILHVNHDLMRDVLLHPCFTLRQPRNGIRV